jgi:hypothetical protein
MTKPLRVSIFENEERWNLCRKERNDLTVNFGFILLSSSRAKIMKTPLTVS